MTWVTQGLKGLRGHVNRQVLETWVTQVFFSWRLPLVAAQNRPVSKLGSPKFFFLCGPALALGTAPHFKTWVTQVLKEVENCQKRGGARWVVWVGGDNETTP